MLVRREGVDYFQFEASATHTDVAYTEITLAEFVLMAMECRTLEQFRGRYLSHAVYVFKRPPEQVKVKAAGA